MRRSGFEGVAHAMPAARTSRKRAIIVRVPRAEDLIGCAKRAPDRAGRAPLATTATRVREQLAGRPMSAPKYLRAALLAVALSTVTAAWTANMRPHMRCDAHALRRRDPELTG